MKRREINSIIDDSIHFIDDHNFLVPPWVRWTLYEWKQNSDRITEIIDNMLGWDITDFGSGDFLQEGLVMLTLRNGNFELKDKYKKTYAEKLLITDEGQITPRHFHWSKMEDIINRGGGNLIVELWKKTEEEALDNSDVTVSIDGILKTVKAGEAVRITPGESITLENGIYHRFYGEAGKGRILLGEISSVNDDTVDNRFYKTLPRFPEIIEDEKVKYPLITEYRTLL